MICSLTVVHLAKSGGLSAPAAGWEHALGLPAGTPSWPLDTCQRWLQVFQGPAARKIRPEMLPEGMEVFHGTEAYEFLLEVATGLASQLAGETNILGQMKLAWSLQSAQVPWLQWLFADAKEIRAKFLSEVGGASYGRLVRQLLRQTHGAEAGPVLVVGAGDMAETICPWLRATRLQILNRTPARAEALAAELRKHPGAAVEVVDPAEAEAAWRGASAVVVCVPFDAAEDARRRNWLRPESSPEGATPVVHLGGNRAQAGAWNAVPRFSCLDDVYALQSQADGRRDRQIALASLACAERARHRGLGSSLSHPHGWEDLPAFFPFTAFQLGGARRASARPECDAEAIAA